MVHLRSVLVAVLGCMALAGPCRGQEGDAEARAVLGASARALLSVDRAQADFSIESLSTGALERISPSGEGKVYWTRAVDADAPADEREAALRIIGQTKRSKDSEAQGVNILARAETLRTIDDDRKRLIERDRTKPAREMNALDTLHVLQLIEDEPYAKALAHATLTLDENNEVGGVPCRVVLAVYPKPPDGESRPAGEVDRERWFIGSEDNLPRRIERVTESLLGNMGTATILTNVRTDAPVPPIRFEMERPEGYRLDTNVPGRAIEPEPRSEAENGSPSVAGTRPPVGRTPAPVRRPPAPLFETRTAGGEEITLDAQIARERVTVLYFWGTWCLAAEEYAPLVDRLARSLAGEPADVIAVSVRERDEGGVVDVHAESLGATTLVLDGDQIARDYRLRVYPTMVVIDKVGGLVTTERPRRGETAAQIMERVEAEVQKALGER